MGHPSREIKGIVNSYLEGARIILGVTGSVAIYKSIDVIRWLVKRGASIRVFMTEEARRYVGEELFYWATGEPPITRLTGDTEHITIVKDSDSMLIAPATLSTIAKIAYGVADNPVAVSALSAIGYGKPVVVVPAMHENLYNTPQLKDALRRLEAIDNVIVVPPLIEDEIAKYPEPSTVARVAAAITRRGVRDLAGRRILVTAGPTREWIDKVRFISNPSSGKMGIEVGLEAWARGAHVDLVHGPISWVPHVLKSYRVETTEEMASMVRKLTGKWEYDAIIAAAAPVDFKPRERVNAKIRSGTALRLELEPTPKVLSSISAKPKVIVAFAAESVGSVDELASSVEEKSRRYGADVVVGNIVGVEGLGFSADESAALVVSRGRTVFKGVLHKELLASIIIDEVSRIVS